MRTDNQNPGNIRDRGRGGGAVGAGIGAGALFAIIRRIGVRGTLIAVVALGAIYFFNPFGLRDAVFGALFGGVPGQQQTQGEGNTCDAHPEACRFSGAILGSTNDVWNEQFRQNRLPNYGQAAGTYVEPTLNVFSGEVATDACGRAPAAVGPFYCPNDRQLYMDPTFFDVMRDRLHSPGDFAQAYVIAHEVGHHVQNLIGGTNHALAGETANQTSVRIELQADCFAGVWGHLERADRAIDEADLREAVTAANAIGDDTLTQGRVSTSEFTHGTSAQRVRWFNQGFNSGDPRQCDTFATPADQL